MLMQLNKCVVCGSDLQRGEIGDGCLFKYERSRGHLFVLSWASVQRGARGSDVLCVVWSVHKSRGDNVVRMWVQLKR